MEIRITYSSVDGFTTTRKFKFLCPAKKWAQSWVGETPELGRFYAISGDGVGRITCAGTTLKELFPRAA